MIYVYRIVMGVATLAKVSNGQDAGFKKVGTYKTDAIAKQACLTHHKKACQLAANKGKPEPQVMFN